MFSEYGALSRVRVEFLTVSKCPHLVELEHGALETMKDLKTLTINGNPKLKYIAPGFLSEAAKLAALDLARNNLYALEFGAVEPVMGKLRALYLAGNNFNCHCSLRWLSQILAEGASGPNGLKVEDDGDDLQCANSNSGYPKVLLREMAGQLSQECEPYILPLFAESAEQMMGRNVSWLCKALGSSDLELYWRLPAPMLVTSSGGGGSRRKSIHQPEDVEVFVVNGMPGGDSPNDDITDISDVDGGAGGAVDSEMISRTVSEGSCLDRACVRENVLTVRYLHPSDTGKYTCVAKSKFGQDQRQVFLTVKVSTNSNKKFAAKDSVAKQARHNGNGKKLYITDTYLFSANIP